MQKKQKQIRPTKAGVRWCKHVTLQKISVWPFTLFSAFMFKQQNLAALKLLVLFFFCVVFSFAFCTRRTAAVGCWTAWTDGWVELASSRARASGSRIRVKHPMSGFDYSKWDRLEISDDETTCLGLGYLMNENSRKLQQNIHKTCHQWIHIIISWPQ